MNTSDMNEDELKNAIKSGQIKPHIFIWGKARPPNMFPQSKDQLTPFHVDNLSLKRIFNISTAKEGSHCFGIGKNNWCFVWGQTKEPCSFGLGNNNKYSTSPFLIRSLKKENIIQISCSSIHTLCITNQFKIYGWGLKLLTLLSYNTNIPAPLSLNYLNNKLLKLNKLSVSNTHSLIYKINTKNVYSFGIKGPWLGLNNYNAKTFGFVDINDTVSYIDCSSQYTLMVFNNGNVGSCGVNEHGRMGLGKHIDKTSDIIINKHLKNIKLCSAGSFHSGYVDINGKVYTCGVANNYRLGHFNSHQTLYIPQLVNKISHLNIIKIECVNSRTFVITKDGKLIMWGKQEINGRIHYQPFMFNYLSPYRILNISCSKDFNVAIGILNNKPKPKPKSVPKPVPIFDNVSGSGMNLNEYQKYTYKLIGNVVNNNHPLAVNNGYNVNNIYGGTLTELKQQQIVSNTHNGPPINAVYGSVAPPPPPPMVYNQQYNTYNNNNNNNNK